MGRSKKKLANAEEPVRARVERRIRGKLFDDEEVVMLARPSRVATFPKFVLTLGLYAFWRKRQVSVLTDRRILLGAGIFSRTERSIPLTHVEDVAYVRSGLSSYVEVTVSGRRGEPVKRLGPMSAGTAHRFSRETLRRI